MRIQLGRTLGLTVLALPVIAAVAMAAGPKKGATYSGTIVQGKTTIKLKVAPNGKAVTVSVPSAPLYCQGGGGPERQITKPAAIGKDGSFKGTITYEFTPTHKNTTKLYFSGKFSGKSVKGSARSEFGLISPEAHKNLAQCNGSASFSAKTK
jgi:hypothetical protein